jgi:hypothetical protein
MPRIRGRIFILIIFPSKSVLSIDLLFFFRMFVMSDSNIHVLILVKDNNNKTHRKKKV